jgi:hypothetical protein
VLAHGVREPSRPWDALHGAGGVGRTVESFWRAGRRCGAASGTPTSWWALDGRNELHTM